MSPENQATHQYHKEDDELVAMKTQRKELDAKINEHEKRHAAKLRKRRSRARQSNEKRLKEHQKRQKRRQVQRAQEQFLNPQPLLDGAIESLRRRFEGRIKESVTYERRMAKVGLDILNRGVIVRGPGSNKQSEQVLKMANFLDPNTFATWLEDNDINSLKTTILRGFSKDTVESRDKFWQRFSSLTATDQKKTKVDIQSTNKNGNPETKQLQWNTVRRLYQESIDDETVSSISMLNLSTTVDSEVRLPPSIQRHINFLSEVVDVANLKKWGPGKKVVESSADITGCLNFTIHASPGSISGWHMDNMGYITVVLMQGNPGDFKLWSIAEIGHLSQERQKEIWLDFGQSGAGWCPPSDVKIMVYELQPNDAMIMMPGTIHAPMTPTPCLLSGMMCYHEKLLARSFQVIDFLNSYPYGTNEDLPTQCLDIIPIILDFVKREPERYGILDLDDFKRICSETIARIETRSKKLGSNIANQRV